MTKSVFTPPRVRHPFEREPVIANTVGDSLTHQSHKEACDIHNILARFDNTGTVPGARPPGSYVDVTSLQGKSRAELMVAGRADLHAKQKALQDLEAKIAAKAKSDSEADKAELVKLRAQLAKAQGESDVK